MKEKPDAQAKKEAGYPLYPLDEAFKIADAVRELGGARTLVQKALLAQRLKYAVTGPSFVQRIASAKAYNLIEGWGSYSLSDAAKRYYFPISEQDKAMASLHFLSAPPLFNLLIQRFNGLKLPNNEMLGNVLHQESNIPASWKGRLAGMFVKSAAYLGIIDADGVLRYNHAMGAQEPSETPVIPNPSSLGAHAPARADAVDHIESEHTVWTYRFKGSRIKLETPQDMPKELWDKLNAYVQILDPGTEK